MSKATILIGRVAPGFFLLATGLLGSVPARAGCIPVIEIVNNGIDEDCDGVDSCYQDLDNDNWGAPVIIDSNDLDCADAFEAPVPGDCNDGSAAVHPGAIEIVGNSNDEDCNGQELCYRDLDNDDYGTTATVTSTDVDCFDNFEATNTTDCNDGNAAVNPGATEIVADNTDQNCDNQELCYQDADNDDYGTTAVITSTDIDCTDPFEAMNTTDCNDGNAAVNPGATEIVANSIDENCNNQEVCYQDLDNDDYGTATVITSPDADCFDAFEATNTTDCNDGNSAAHPGALEIVANNNDEDCNGTERCYRDLDNDDYGTFVVIESTDIDCLDAFEATNTTDCNDGSAAINPGATEIVADNIDENCNGQELCYQDADNDDYGTTGVVTSTDIDCTDPFEAMNTTDCNDGNAAIYPGATEICNTLDDDCDTLVDEFPPAGGVPGLALGPASTQISWPAIPSATRYDVVKGRLVALATSFGNFTIATTGCLANDIVATGTTDGAVPGVGDGFWYLVRGINCSTPGTYDSGALSQAGLRDAEIAAAPAPCP